MHLSTEAGGGQWSPWRLDEHYCSKVLSHLSRLVFNTFLLSISELRNANEIYPSRSTFRKRVSKHTCVDFLTQMRERWDSLPSVPLFLPDPLVCGLCVCDLGICVCVWVCVYVCVCVDDGIPVYRRTGFVAQRLSFHLYMMESQFIRPLWRHFCLQRLHGRCFALSLPCNVHNINSFCYCIITAILHL